MTENGLEVGLASLKSVSGDFFFSFVLEVNK